MATLYALRDGSTTTDPRLGRLKQFDERSRRFQYGIRAQVFVPKTKVWVPQAALDQGVEGTCVGHGFGHEANAMPVQPFRTQTHTDALSWFDMAARIDPWPGEDRANGTSVLCGAKIGVQLGWYTAYNWAFDLQSALMALCEQGPLVMGTDWLDGMWDTDDRGQLRVSGTPQGGHCWIVFGFVKAGDVNPISNDIAPVDVVLMQNSWGLSWGLGGRAWMTVEDYDILRKAGGEVCIPVGRKDPTLVLKPEPPKPKPKPAGHWKYFWDRIRRRWKRIWIAS